jgi:hypothetical protein
MRRTASLRCGICHRCLTEAMADGRIGHSSAMIRAVSTPARVP